MRAFLFRLIRYRWKSVVAGVQQSRVELGRYSAATAAVEVAACSFGSRMEEDAPLLVRSGGLTGEVCLLHWWKIHRPLLRTRQRMETSLAEILEARARSPSLNPRCCLNLSVMYHPFRTKIVNAQVAQFVSPSSLQSGCAP